MVAAIGILRVHAVELPHSGGEIAFYRFYDEVVVVAHLAPRVNPPVVAFTDLREDRKPCQTVGVVVVDILTPVATRGYVIQAAGNFKTERTGHGESVNGGMLFSKTPCDVITQQAGGALRGDSAVPALCESGLDYGTGEHLSHPPYPVRKSERAAVPACQAGYCRQSFGARDYALHPIETCHKM